MSVARGFGLNGKSIYANVTKLMEVDLQFTVTPTNGLGVTSVKSNGYVRNVFMHTSTTPASNNGATNPNPANGFALIQLNNTFNKFLGLAASIQSPNSGSDVKIDNSAMTAGQAYTITTLGNATAAKWLAIGVPAGVTPAVGVSFIALTNGGAGNTLTSRVQTPSNSGIARVEVVGDPNLSIGNTSLAANGGAYLLVQFLYGTLTMNSYTPAGTNNGASPPIFTGTPATLTGTISGSVTAPATGSVISLRLKFDGSSVTIDGL